LKLGELGERVIKGCIMELSLPKFNGEKSCNCRAGFLVLQREDERERESELGWFGLKQVGDFGYIDA
jgi:hypothetical protein